MESWEGLNYYTRDIYGWTNLMNRSTAELGVGWFPSNVIAIPDTIANTTEQLRSDAVVIENASRADIGDRGIEKIVFGVTSGIVLLWAVLWLSWRCWTGTLLSPRTSPQPISQKSSVTATEQNGKGVGDGETGFVTAEYFEEQLNHYYHPDIDTKLEMQEKDISTEGVSAADAEAMTDLLRKMYKLDLTLWSEQSVRGEQTDAANIVMKSEAIWEEVRRELLGWTAQQGVTRWDDNERQQLHNISRILHNMPQRRYNQAAYQS
jgi:hypothetical protein